MTGHLIFEEVQRSRHQLVLNYRIDQLIFSTVYWYDTVNFYELETRFGEDFMRRVYFHLLAFEANKAASLKPAILDLGPYQDLYSPAFHDLWYTIFHNVWAVWRHDNDITDYAGPQVPQDQRRQQNDSATPVQLKTEEKLLNLCGGGKDSLVSAKLLERAGLKYDVMVYSHNIYGQAQRQHDLIDGMLRHTAVSDRHRAWVYDTALDSPAAQLHPEYGVHSLLAAETVSSYWTALPIALQHDYTQVALGVTKSTDEHNLVWQKTGEEVNYLWGMSTAAEKLLGDYIQAELVSNLSYFHLLRPIYDIVVFNLLAKDETAVPSTHSCAQQKPWCCQCPKCIYVWMHLVAYLDETVVEQMFDKNLFDMPENRTHIRKMLGLEGYKPCDCVGTVSETQVAYLLCRAKGKSGQAVNDILPSEISVDVNAFLEKYALVDSPQGAIPTTLYENIKPQLLDGAKNAQAYVKEYL
ncbi:MAG: hypothetical protein GY796_18735 [Chloroflexi bacterium]|nr:hypothetical protein [Chloroflexota bacterium]